jgi:probable HAF family extracellular repeat protein
MRSKLWSATAMLCALALLAMPPQLIVQAQNAPPAQYIITDLGTLPGGVFSTASYISNNSVVGGISLAPDFTQHAVLWNKGAISDITTPGLGGPNSGVFGVNNQGQVDGQAEGSANDPNGENFCAYFTGLVCLPFLWQNGVMTALPTLGGPNGTVGNINSRGEVAGVAETNTPDAQCPAGPQVNGTGPQVLGFKPVIWGPKPGQIRQLSLLPGDTVGMALWVNDLGQAVGISGTCANTLLPPFAASAHAVLWQADGSVTDLGNLGGTFNPNALGIGNVAFAINNKGQVTGAMALPGSQTLHPFLWSPAKGLQDLGLLPGDVNGAGLGMNTRGDVVGASIDGPVATGNPRAVIWQNGVANDLNALVPASTTMYLLTAFTNNDAGQIVGFGLDLNTFEVHAFLATPYIGNGAPPARGAMKTIVIPDNVRKLLQRRLQ